MSSDDKKINSALYGINVAQSWPDETDYISFDSRETDPPGYMIKMVLYRLYGKRLPRGGDKSEWALPIEYQGHTFVITDYRRYSWNIYGHSEGRRLVPSLKKKIISAANLLNKFISQEAKSHFEHDDLFLQNHYHRTLALYNHFYEATTSLLAEDDAAHKQKKKRKDSRLEGIATILNAEIRRHQMIERNLIATAIFFFSLTEVLFDICFALGDRRNVSYKQYRESDWSDRFKSVFDVSKKSNISKLYTDLIAVRRYYRNIPVHASPEFFFHLKDFGLIPSDYAALSSPHMSEPLGFRPETAISVLQLFDAALKLFNNGGVAGFAKIYAAYDLAIPISIQAAAEVKRFMTSKKVFKTEMNKRASYQDAIDNMEI